jgi:protein-serine/threonine kinase
MYGFGAGRQQQSNNNNLGPSQPTSSADIYAQFYDAPFPPIRPAANDKFGRSGGLYARTSKILSGGTILHKGFYDLLSLIPTPVSASRFWASLTPDPVAGPRYEDQALNTGPGPIISNAPISASPKYVQPSSRKPTGPRITKEMVSKPTGFVYAPLSIELDPVMRSFLLQTFGACF